MVFAELFLSPPEDVSVWSPDYEKVTEKTGEAFILTEGTTIISLVVLSIHASIDGISDRSSYRASAYLLATDFAPSVMLLAHLFVNHTP